MLFLNFSELTVSVLVPTVSKSTLLLALSSQHVFKKSELDAEGESTIKNAFLSSSIVRLKYLSLVVEKYKPLNELFLNKRGNMVLDMSWRIFVDCCC